MTKVSPRIVSLLPSTTEIVCALDMEKILVGRSHECDYPPSVRNLPSCTEPKFEPDGTSYQINERVKVLLQEGLSVYRVDAGKLASLEPDIIITQDHCEVCAASLPEVKEAVQTLLNKEIEILSVSPTDLSGVYDSFKAVADTVGVPENGKELVASMKSKLDYIRQRTVASPVKTLCCLEWLDPLMTAGNWVPELVEIAGGQALGASAGEHSPWFSMEKLSAADPEQIAIMPCGYSIEQTLEEIESLTKRDGWEQLQAVRDEEIYILDGNRYFNRPGPRLVDSARILTEILHPEKFESKYKQQGWIKLKKQPT